MPLINCEMELILNLPKDCVLADMTIRAAGNNDDPPAFLALTGVEFQIMETKLYIMALISHLALYLETVFHSYKLILRAN